MVAELRYVTWAMRRSLRVPEVVIASDYLEIVESSKLTTPTATVPSITGTGDACSLKEHLLMWRLRQKYSAKTG